jgi:hypothetical protein
MYPGCFRRTEVGRARSIGTAAAHLAWRSVTGSPTFVKAFAARVRGGRPSRTAQQSRAADDSNWFTFMLEDSERVSNKLHETLDPQLYVLFLLGGMLPNASARINSELGSRQDATDNALFILNSRITTGCVSTYTLAMRGLGTDAAGTLRHVVENVGLAIAMMHTPGVAERWQRGRQYRPAEVRAMISPAIDLQPLYRVLSEYAHANAAGQALYRTSTQGGYVVTYSGSYQPKNVALTLVLMAQTELLYLREFYGRYSGRLSIETWPLLLDLATKLTDTLHAWAQAQPDDWIELRKHYATGKGLMPAPVIDPELRRQAQDAMERIRASQPPREP